MKDQIYELELARLKERILEEANAYSERFPDDVYLDNFYSDEFVEFEDKYNLELMFWIENNEVHIQEV